MSEAEHRIRAFLDANFLRETAFLAALVQIPSDNPPGDCAPHAARAALELEQLGFTVERHKPPAELVAQHGMQSCTNLVVRHRFGDGPTIALNAHGDVVPPGEGWSHPPYSAAIVDGWMVGRGAAVSKSDFATYAFALRALIESGAPLRGTVELHFTYDEEIGGTIGPAWLLGQGIVKPDFALCAGFSYEIVIAHNGCLHWEVAVRGRSAHAAIPSTGADALEAANAILTRLYAYRREIGARVSATPGIGSPQLTVGLIEGGINTNVVPDRVTLRIDRRLIPDEDVTAAERDLRAVIAAAVEGHTGITIEQERILLAKPLTPLAGTETLIAALQKRANEIMGERVTTAATPLYTDARHYAEAGVPVVLYGAGPRTIAEANGHRADERLPLDALRKATEVVALTLLDMLA